MHSSSSLGASASTLIQQARQLVKEKQAQQARNEDLARQNVAEIEKLEHQIRKVTAETQEMSTTLCLYEDEMDKIHAVTSTLDQRLAQADQNLQEIEGQLKRAQEIVATVEHIDAYVTTVLNARRDQGKVVHQILYSHNTWLTNQVPSIQANLEAQLRSKEKVFLALEVGLSKLKMDFASSEATIASLKSQTEATQNTLQNIHARKAKREQEIEAATLVKSQTANQVETQETQVNELKARVLDTEQELARHQAAIEKTAKDLALESDSAEQLVKARVNEANKRILVANQRKEERQARIKALQTEFAMLEQTRVDQAAQAKQAHLSKIRKSCQERLEAQVQQLTKQKESLLEEKTLKTKQLGELMKKPVVKRKLKHPITSVSATASKSTSKTPHQPPKTYQRKRSLAFGSSGAASAGGNGTNSSRGGLARVVVGSNKAPTGTPKNKSPHIGRFKLNHNSASSNKSDDLDIFS